MKAKFHLLDHPLVRHKLGYLRDKTTLSNEFRELTKEVSRILAYEAMREWSDFDHVEVDTPIARAKSTGSSILRWSSPSCARGTECWMPFSQ